MKDWFKLYTTRNYIEANIIKGMLEENNIETILFNKQDSTYLVFGEIELYVHFHFKDVARHLLDQSLFN